MAVGSYCYYEKVCRTMHTAIVSCFLKYIYSFSAAELNKNRVLNIHSICNCFTVCFQLVMVMVLTLLFHGYFGKLWCICDLISMSYLSVENCPCYSYGLKSLTKWGCAVRSNQTFVEELLVSYLWLVWLK